MERARAKRSSRFKSDPCQTFVEKRRFQSISDQKSPRKGSVVREGKLSGEIILNEFKKSRMRRKNAEGEEDLARGCARKKFAIQRGARNLLARRGGEGR